MHDGLVTNEFDDIFRRFEQTKPVWKSVANAIAFGCVGVGLWISCIGLAIYAGLPHAQDWPWAVIIGVVLAVGLVLVIVSLVLLLRWFRQHRAGHEDTAST